MQKRVLDRLTVYRLWIVRDLIKNRVVLLGCLKLGLDVILLLEGGGISVEEVREILHDGGSWYNLLSTLGVNHEHEPFGKRNLVEQMFRSLKLRLARMDKHFPHNASKVTILR